MSKSNTPAMGGQMPARKWYVAHAIILFKDKAGIQQKHPVWENVILIEASSDESAMEKASAIARKEEGDDRGSLTFGGRPSTRVFMGIRKLILCGDASGSPPCDGCELTYSQFSLDDEESLSKLIAGESVDLTYEE